MKMNDYKGLKITTAKSSNSNDLLQLQEEKSILDSIMMHGPAWINICNQFGTITRINNAGISLMEATTPTDLIGKRLLDFALNYSFKGCQSELIPNEIKIRNLKLLTLKGNYRWVEARTILLPRNAEHARIISIIWDRTEEILAKKQHAKQQQKLTKILKFNTLSAISSGLAHELNQPLTALSQFISGYETKINSGSLSEDEAIDVIQLMKIQTERALELVHQVKKFAVSNDTTKEPVDLNKTLLSTIDLMHSLGQTDEVKFILNLENNLPLVSISKTHIEQVFVNLISNATDSIKSSKTKKPAITLTSHFDMDNSAVYFTIIDNGKGFEEKQLEKIFIPFSSEKADHLGLGLNISQTILEFYNSGLEISNNLAETGASISFYLPIK